MNITKCENGHFFDADKYNNCPHCNGIIDRNTIITEPERPIMYDLKLIKKGIDSNKEIFLRGNQIYAGRDTNNCQITLESIYAARMHARFVCENGLWSIIDTSSTNGTTINGFQIEANKPILLNNNDEIAFSPTDIFVYLDSNIEKHSYCYNCGHLIKSNNDSKLPIICDYCNESQETADKEYTSLICDNCYMSNMMTDNFCRSCGNPLKSSVINKQDYYICVYTETSDVYFNHRIKGINILANSQMTNISLRINAYGEVFLFLLNTEKDNEIQISRIITGGPYRLFSGFHKETITSSFVLDKANAYDFYSGFGQTERNRLYYIISKKPISPIDVIGEFIQKSPNSYLSKAEFVNCLADVAEQFNAFIKQLKGKSKDFDFSDFNNLINGRTIPLASVLPEPTDISNDACVLLSSEKDEYEINIKDYNEYPNNKPKEIEDIP